MNVSVSSTRAFALFPDLMLAIFLHFSTPPFGALPESFLHYCRFSSHVLHVWTAARASRGADNFVPTEANNELTKR